MTNLQRLVTLLSRERYARQWDDEVVARAILAELGMDAGAETAPEALPEPVVEAPATPFPYIETAGDPVGGAPMPEMKPAV